MPSSPIPKGTNDMDSIINCICAMSVLIMLLILGATHHLVCRIIDARDAIIDEIRFNRGRKDR